MGSSIGHIMTPEEALKIFENIRLKVQLTGQDHDAVREAIRVLTEAIKGEA